MHARPATTIPEIVPKELWDLEFTTGRCIPSSSRKEPARALLLFVELLQLRGPIRVLDAGCGNGRNAVYLAKRGCDVIALDFSESALGETQRRASEEGVADRVSIVRYFLDDPVPFSENSFDFVLDAYVFCHFLREDTGREFWRDMSRVVRPDGHLLSIVFSPEDEYYARFLKDSPDGSLVCDPANGIWKRLYTEREIKGVFAAFFELRYFVKFEFSDVVLGRPYRRVLLTSVLRKRAA